MSKQEKAKPSVVPQTSAELPSGVISTNENLQTVPIMMKSDIKSHLTLDFLKTNVNKHTEKKNGLTYLSWAWAWAEVLKADTSATFHVEQFNGMPYMDVNGTGMVWVTVTIFDQPRTCMLPVMDYRNKPIQNPDAFQVNTAIMRCLVKAVALHGLGLYIYAGEDLPEDSDEPVSVAKAETPKAKKYEDDASSFFAEKMIEYADKAWHVQSVADLTDYWKSNQERLEDLKRDRPDLWENVKNHFTELKLKFKDQKQAEFNKAGT